MGKWGSPLASGVGDWKNKVFFTGALLASYHFVWLIPVVVLWCVISARQQSPVIQSNTGFFVVFLGGGGGTLQYVGSWFPDQGLNRHPQHWKRNLNHWTAREVHRTSLDVAVKVCFPGGISVIEPPGNAGDPGDIPEFDPWVRKIPWWRAWQPTPVFLPGEFHGQRSLPGYSP